MTGFDGWLSLGMFIGSLGGLEVAVVRKRLRQRSARADAARRAAEPLAVRVMAGPPPGGAGRTGVATLVRQRRLTAEDISQAMAFALERAPLARIPRWRRWLSGPLYLTDPAEIARVMNGEDDGR